MRSIVEPRVRRLVAEHLGVTESELAPELSLIEDLAADSLDFAELAIAVEDDLDLIVPDHVLDRVRTYGDLIEATVELARARLTAQTPPVPVVARVHRASGTEDARLLERTGLLTPYLAETLADDVLHAGPGGRIEVLVAAAVEELLVQHVRDTFAWLTERGVEVSVTRERQGGRHGGPRHQAA